VVVMFFNLSKLAMMVMFFYLSKLTMVVVLNRPNVDSISLASNECYCHRLNYEIFHLNYRLKIS